MRQFLSQPWPWYVAGPIVGLMVPLLLLAGNRLFGVSSSLGHLCAALAPNPSERFRYDWKRTGSWSLAFAAGIVLGGFLAATYLASPGPIEVSDGARRTFAALGLGVVDGLVPPELFSLGALFTLKGFVTIVVGGFLVGFGSRYADGCAMGHGITGLALLQRPSLVAVLGFFAGGLLASRVLLPLLP